MYAADVCANVYKANILTQIVSKIIADIPSAKHAKLSSQLSEEETEYPFFDLFGSIFAEPPAKRFASLSESNLDDLVSERHSKKTKEVTTGLCPHLKVNNRLLKLSWNSLIGFTIKIQRLIKEIVSVKICVNPIKC